MRDQPSFVLGREMSSVSFLDSWQEAAWENQTHAQLLTHSAEPSAAPVFSGALQETG